MTNIIEVLLEDHTRLRWELMQIRRGLSDPGARNKIKDFISSYELHESIEEEMLFPNVRWLMEAAPGGSSLEPYHENHERLWKELTQLVDSLGRISFTEMQRVFFSFAASAEAHMEMEERALFPVIRRRVDREILDSLGQKAEERCARFSMS